MSKKTTKKKKIPVEPEETKIKTKIVVTQKLSIGTMRDYFVVEMDDQVVYILNATSVSKLVVNYIDSDQLIQMWSDIQDRSRAVIFKVS